MNDSKKTKIITKKKIGNKEVIVTVKYNKPSDEAIRNLANGLRRLYKNK